MSIAMTAAAPHPAGDRPVSERLQQEGLSENERNYALAIHLSPLAGLVFGPLIFAPLIPWLIKKDKSAFVDDHGREVVNFGISYLLLSLLLFWTIVVPIALAIVAFVNFIRGAVAASNGQYFRYPMTIRFLSLMGQTLLKPGMGSPWLIGWGRSCVSYQTARGGIPKAR